MIATKLRAPPLTPGTGFLDNPEGLSAKVIHESAEHSRERLRVDRLDLLYAHIDDHTDRAGRRSIPGPGDDPNHHTVIHHILDDQRGES